MEPRSPVGGGITQLYPCPGHGLTTLPRREWILTVEIQCFS